MFPMKRQTVVVNADEEGAVLGFLLYRFFSESIAVLSPRKGRRTCAQLFLTVQAMSYTPLLRVAGIS